MEENKKVKKELKNEKKSNLSWRENFSKNF